MKKKNIKIVVVPHYSGSVKTSEVFKRIITEQIEKKLSQKLSIQKTRIRINRRTKHKNI